MWQLTVAHNVRTLVWGDRQIEKLGAESLNLELGDTHSSVFCHQIPTKASV